MAARNVFKDVFNGALKDRHSTVDFISQAFVLLQTQISALTIEAIGDAHSECFTFSMKSSLTSFSRVSSYLGRIANGTTGEW